MSSRLPWMQKQEDSGSPSRSQPRHKGSHKVQLPPWLQEPPPTSSPTRHTARSRREAKAEEQNAAREIAAISKASYETLEGANHDLAPGTKVVIHSNNPVLCGQTATIIKYAGGRLGYELKLDNGKTIHKLPAMVDLVTGESVAWSNQMKEESEEKASFFDLENNRMVREIGEISHRAMKAREKVHSFFSETGTHATGAIDMVRTGTSDFFSPAFNTIGGMFHSEHSDDT